MLFKGPPNVNPENQTTTTTQQSTTSSAPVSTDTGSSSSDQPKISQEAHDAFSAAFGGEDGAQSSTPASAQSAPAGAPTKKETATTAAAAPAAKTTTTPAASAAVTPEEKAVLAGFTETQIKQILGMVPEHSKHYTQISTQMRQINGWIGGIKDRLDKLSKPAASAQGPAASTPQPQAVADAMKKLKEDLPDVAAVLELAIANMPTGAAGISKEDLERIVGERVSAAQQEWRSEARSEGVKSQQRALFKAHPELREAMAKAPKGTTVMALLPGFGLWLAAQPADYQRELNAAEDWDTVSEGFTKFKDWQAKQRGESDEAKRQREEAARKAASRERSQSRLESAVAPTGTPASGPTTESPESAFQRAYGGGG